MNEQSRQGMTLDELMKEVGRYYLDEFYTAIEHMVEYHGASKVARLLSDCSSKLYEQARQEALNASE